MLGCHRKTQISVRAVSRGTKVSSEKDPKYIYAKEHKLYYYCYHFGGHWKYKNWKKKWQQNSKNYLLHQRCEKTVINTVMAPQSWLAVYVVRLFDSHFKNGLFQRTKIHFNPAKFSI